MTVRVPGLDPAASYRDCAGREPGSLLHTSMSAPLPEQGPTDGREVSGGSLATRGFWIPRRRPETVTLVHVERV